MPPSKRAGALAREVARRRKGARKIAAVPEPSRHATQRVTPYGVITVRSGRPLGYTADLKAHARYRFEETPESAYSIAADLGIHHVSLKRLATREGWVRRNPPSLRDITPAMRLAAAAEAMVRVASPPPGGGRACPGLDPGSTAKRPGGGGALNHQSHPTPDGLRPSDPPPPGEGGTAPAARPLADTATIERLEAAVLKELAAVELMRAGLGGEPLRPLEAQVTARTLSILTETLAKLRRLRLGAQPQADDHDDGTDDIADIDAFRLDLARRIDLFVASRTDARHGDGDPGAAAVGEAG